MPTGGRAPSKAWRWFRETAVMTAIDNAVHLCVDMQRIFSRGGIWETPWMERVLPTITAIVARCPERTVFTRFVTPASAEQSR